MTRIFTDGAEMGDTLFWTGGSYVTAVSANPAPYESAYCYKIAWNANPTIYSYKAIDAISECYIRERVYFENVLAGGNTNLKIKFPIFSYDTTQLAWLSVDDTRHVTVNTSAGVLDTSTETVSNDQWYLFEVYFKLDDAPNGRFHVYMDGIDIIDFTGDTKPGAETTFNRVSWNGSSSYPPPYYIAIDDLALNDTAGGSDDSWCGDGVIIKVTPDGDGTHNNWHGSDGNDISNYLLVDDYPHDTDTTYVYHDGAISGTQDQYDLSDYDGTDKTITRIYAEARLRKTAAAAYTVKIGFLASGGTDELSAAQNLSSTYTRIIGDEHTVNPVDSGAWEEADIDALEFVVEVG